MGVRFLDRVVDCCLDGYWVVVFGWLIILWLAGWILFDLFFSLRVNGFTGRSY